MARARDGARLGVDIGGTFTDLALLDGASLRIHKVPSTPECPQRAVVDGAAELAPGHGLDVVHGSTVATNAFLERKGARTAFLATAGFEDIPFLGRQSRPALYALGCAPPRPVIAAGDVFGVAERVTAAGERLAALREAAARRIARRVASAGHRSAAICLLFSFLAPDHERLLGRLLAEAGVEAHLSSDVLPRAGEFERASATILNAYLSPLVRRYLEDLERRLAPRSFAVMRSSGGCLSAATAARMGLASILSGPAGGVVGAIQAGGVRGRPRLITFDMGGTSTDVSLVDGRPQLSRDYRIDGWPLGIPVLDIRTIGAGGGSLACVDRGGCLRVGPESAGADPGPACYGRERGSGRRELAGAVTVTDAHVVLGHVQPDRFLGGRMALDPDLSWRAAKAFGRRLSLGPRAAAAGVLAVVRSNMQRAVRAVSVARGHDPADFTLVSFGGAGGLHAFFLARALSIGKVLVPRHPGALSALGMLGADHVAECERSAGRALARGVARCARGAGVAALLEPGFGELAAAARAQLAGTPGAPAVIECEVGLRYVGRSEEIQVPWTDRGGWTGAQARFHALHRRLHGTADTAEPLELVSLHVRAVRPGRPLRYPRLTAGQGERAGGSPGGRVKSGVGAARVDTVRAAIEPGDAAPPDRGEALVPVLDRARLGAGMRVAGPAVLIDETATTLIPAGFVASVDACGNLLGERE
jgi:N-methylhydantoinase A